MHHQTSRLSRQADRQEKLLFKIHGTIITAHHLINYFSLASKQFKKLFLKSSLGKTLLAMSFTKSVLEGLKNVACECGIGVKNALYVTFPSRILYRILSRRKYYHLFKKESSKNWESVEGGKIDI